MEYKCKYCGYIGSEFDFEINHATPQARSYFANMLENLQFICSGRNRQKGIKTDVEYQLWRFMNPGQINFGPIRQ